MVKKVLFSKKVDVSTMNADDGKRAVKIAAVIAFVVGLVLCIGGSARLIYLNSISKEYIETTARIENIEIIKNKKRSGKDETSYKVTVSYMVDDVPYQRLLSSYASSMSVGDDISIFYNPQNPSEILSMDIQRILSMVVAICGCIVLLISCFLPKMYQGWLKLGKKEISVEKIIK